MNPTMPHKKTRFVLVNKKKRTFQLVYIAIATDHREKNLKNGKILRHC